MQPIVWFWVSFVVLTVIIVFLDAKYSMLRDISVASSKPFSFSRVQLAWWSVILISSFISIIISRGAIPEFGSHILILLGITSATAATARVIDHSDETAANGSRFQNDGGGNFILDILSDKNGVSISRFQTVIFNVLFGAWFIAKVISNLKASAAVSEILPFIDNNNLILLGMSSGTYAALKLFENKSAPNKQPYLVSDEATAGGKAQG